MLHGRHRGAAHHALYEKGAKRTPLHARLRTIVAASHLAKGATKDAWKNKGQGKI